MLSFQDWLIVLVCTGGIVAMLFAGTLFGIGLVKELTGWDILNDLRKGRKPRK